MTELKFNWVNDDVCEVYLDGDYVGNMHYDLHGRDGMRGIQQVLYTVAEFKGWAISVEGSPGI